MATSCASRLFRPVAMLAMIGAAALPLLLPAPAQAWGGRANVFVNVRIGAGHFFAPRPFFRPHAFFAARPFFERREFFVRRPFFARRDFDDRRFFFFDR
jgi:hypothetical protein